MKAYYIFLIAMGIAAANGLEVPPWAWITTVALAFVTAIELALKEMKEKEWTQM